MGQVLNCVRGRLFHLYQVFTMCLFKQQNLYLSGNMYKRRDQAPFLTVTLVELSELVHVVQWNAKIIVHLI